MMPNEVAQLRTMAEMNRRLRRENEHLLVRFISIIDLQTGFFGLGTVLVDR